MSKQSAYVSCKNIRIFKTLAVISSLLGPYKQLSHGNILYDIVASVLHACMHNKLCYRMICPYFLQDAYFQINLHASKNLTP